MQEFDGSLCMFFRFLRVGSGKLSVQTDMACSCNVVI